MPKPLEIQDNNTPYQRMESHDTFKYTKAGFNFIYKPFDKGQEKLTKLCGPGDGEPSCAEDTCLLPKTFIALPVASLFAGGGLFVDCARKIKQQCETDKTTAPPQQKMR
jgi:hypothetical protein